MNQTVLVGGQNQSIQWISSPSRLVAMLIAMEKTKLTLICSNGDVCSFPFRFKGILYYACTNITINGTAADELGSPENPIHICATEHNEDFNPIKMGFCDTSFR